MEETKKNSLRDTLNLPETSFPMKANLAVREPEQIKSWLEKGIYQKLQAQNASKPIFSMPDGPPYANGNIHVGHALNKILKDFAVKYRAMSGYQAVFIPGWDCHGLPIEHAVSKELGNKRREKSDGEIRKLCRDYAAKYIDLQREQFKRLGVMADWDHPYTTMDTSYEAEMIRALGRIYDAGYIYRGEKPVHWCWSDGTALAEAEVEYADRTDPSIYVKLEVTGGLEKLGGSKAKTFFVIWTTTPWTLPANLAVCLGAQFDYGLYDVGTGENWILATALSENLQKILGAQWKLLKTYKGSDLGATKIDGLSYNTKGETKFKDSDGLVCRHPFLNRSSFVILGDHVTLDAGTGCVHTAPGHGMEDYIVGMKYGLPAYNPVDDWGKYYPEMVEQFSEVAGKRVFDANQIVIDKLRSTGNLVFDEKFPHSFPHCWRCHNPVIFRATAQWFISMDQSTKQKPAIRAQALTAIKEVKWVPSWGQNRITAMVENRPDWCISRQRLWGVPIPVFYCESCGKAEISADLMNKVADRVDAQGLESWYTSNAEDFLGKKKCSCGADKFRRGKDILDVWFDSGVCHMAVQNKRDGLKRTDGVSAADLYLEGSDQHRGWFQSSLLTSIAINGAAPFKTVLTHGFVNDAQGRKMSKSLGNVVDPLKIMETSGAEILRLWTASEDFSNDLGIGKESLDRVSECYRRVRNTFKYMLGNLGDFDPVHDSVSFEKLLELDRWALHRLHTLLTEIVDSYENYQFHRIYQGLQDYVVSHLSAVFLDISKDRLYTFKKTSLERRSGQTVIYLIVENLARVLAPIFSFLSEEVYASLPGSKRESVFLAGMPDLKSKAMASWADTELGVKYEGLMEARTQVTKALEEKRQAKVIGSGLEAKIALTAPEASYKILESVRIELPSLFIVSAVNLKSGAAWDVQVESADGEKCERCWNFSTELKTVGEFQNICPKCTRALT